MPLPFKPSEVCANVPSATSSLCDRILAVFLRIPAQLCQFFTYMFNEDGTISDAFKDEAQIIPTGCVIARMSTVAPAGWLICDGQQVSRTTYAMLFSVIGTNFGAGNGTTTFTLPDLRDRFLYGKGASSNIADVGGEATHVLSVAEMPSHSHAHRNDTDPGGADANLCIYDGVSLGAGGGFTGIRFGGSTATKVSGADGAHNNLPPFVRTTWLIKT